MDNIETLNKADASQPVMISVDHEIKPSRVADLLVTAIEGGSGYWCAIDKARSSKPAELTLPWGIDKHTGEPEYHPWYISWPFSKDGNLALVIDDGESDPEEDPEVYYINRESLVKGLMIMAQKYPAQFHDFLDENEDAWTADTFLQCCALGEVIYG